LELNIGATSWLSAVIEITGYVMDLVLAITWVYFFAQRVSHEAADLRWRARQDSTALILLRSYAVQKL